MENFYFIFFTTNAKIKAYKVQISDLVGVDMKNKKDTFIDKGKET